MIEGTTLWLLLAGVLVAVEMLTGTFYLLMMSLGAMSGAIAAHFAATVPVQIAVAGVVGGLSVLILHFRKIKKAAPPVRGNLDVGNEVVVSEWGADGTGVVEYRGARWGVTLVAGEEPSPGRHQIVEVDGGRLIVKKL